MEIKKAVIAVAGYGTRFLPATKNQPKEMLPIIDKPIVQYLVEEAVASGIEDVILVTRAGQTSLENHFDTNLELEMQLKKNGKKEMLKRVQEISRLANFVYVRQKKHLPYGNATPLVCVKELIDEDEAFVYMFGDDLVKARVPAVKQLIEVFEKLEPAVMLAVQKVPWSEVERYATVRYREGTKINQIEEIMEKLPRKKALSQMAQFGRFIFTYKMIEEVEKMPTGKSGELWVADAINRLAKKGEKVIAQSIKGKWMTTGDPLRFMKTSVEYALDREDIGPAFRKYLKSLKL